MFREGNFQLGLFASWFALSIFSPCLGLLMVGNKNTWVGEVSRSLLGIE